MTFTPDSALLATNDHGLVSLWNVSNPVYPAITSTVDTTATGDSLEVVITPDGHTMITAMNNQKVSVWDITNPSRPRHLRDVIRTNAGPGIYRISPDGHAVVSAARPHHDTITIWPIP